MIQVAVIGYGNIGSGVCEVIERSSALIARKVGDEVKVKYILDIRELKGDPRESLLVKDLDTIVNDPEVSIVVETMGGTNPSYPYVKRCLEAGKSVASSNKELVAAYGADLLKTAKEHNVSFLFEASCGGGIPIIRPLNDAIVSDAVCSIVGILNGTTNYMLTKMSREGASFEDVLKEAQRLGYAEKDPTADIEGFDPCRKISILCSIVFGKTVKYEDVTTEGITSISDVDMKYAACLGKTIKLLACGYVFGDKCFAIVAPRMIPLSHPLASVNDVLNGILVNGEMMGDLMFYGPGAGKLPTATAVVADVVEEAMNPGKTLCQPWSEEPVELMDIDDTEWSYFVRLKKQAEEMDLEALFGPGMQVEIDGAEDELAYITENMKERDFKAAAEKVKDLMINRIRMA